MCDQNVKRDIFVWKEVHERQLLMEVLMFEPYKFKFGSKEKGAAWTNIASRLQELGMKVNQRSVRERFDKMVKAFKRKDSEEKRASGVEVDYTEKDKAMMDVVERMSEVEKEMYTEKEKQRQDKLTAEEMRRKAMESLGETQRRAYETGGEPSKTPGSKRRRSNEMEEFLKESLEVKRMAQMKEQELREGELAFRRSQLESQQRFQMSIIEQQQNYQLQQQNMNMAMINMLSELVKSLKNN